MAQRESVFPHWQYIARGGRPQACLVCRAVCCMMFCMTTDKASAKRATLAIDDDTFAAAEHAKHTKRTKRNGVPLLLYRPGVAAVTLALVNQLRDEQV